MKLHCDSKILSIISFLFSTSSFMISILQAFGNFERSNPHPSIVSLSKNFEISFRNYLDSCILLFLFLLCTKNDDILLRSSLKISSKKNQSAERWIKMKLHYDSKILSIISFQYFVFVKFFSIL